VATTRENFASKKTSVNDLPAPCELKWETVHWLELCQALRRYALSCLDLAVSNPYIS
jgi:hypothetical protein